MSRVMLAAALFTMLLASSARAQDILIELDRFGVGSAFRPGGWVAVRFRVSLRSGDPLPVQLVWETPNADGDIAENTRAMVLNPGSPTVRWLSAFLLPTVESNTTFAVRVYADDNGRRGRELSSVRISPTSATMPGTFVDLSQSLLGVLGDARLNLESYSAIFGGHPFPRGMNEVTRVVGGLDARELPDRWEGLAMFEALIWTDASPTALELEEAEALRQYLARGGQLVIALPQAGNPWGFGSSAGNALSDLLPSKAPRRLEGVPIGQLTPLLSKVDGVLNPRSTTNISVWDPETLDRGWVPFLSMPAPRDPGLGEPPTGLEGLCVGIQRLVQHGRITIVGVDVNAISRMGLQPGGLPQADAFWNRILGRRGDTPSMAELDLLDKASPRKLAPESTTRFTMGGGDLIASRIGMTGPAVTGTLLALLVFGAYWLIAGPASYLALKRTGRVRHSWLAFVAAGLVFTGIAWAGGAALRLGNVRLQHVTVLDHIARVPGDPPSSEPQFQRAISWMSIYLATYGSAKVSIDSEPGHRDLLASWMAPGTSTQRFPNVDRYTVPYSAPNALELPSRATATLLEARWLGSLDPAFGRFPYASDPDRPVREIITRSPSLTARLEGVLRHDLRGTLTDVSVVHVSSIRTPLRRVLGTRGIAAAQPAVPGELPSVGLYFAKTAWAPGEALDLSQMYIGERTGELAPLRPEDARSTRSLTRTLVARYRDPIAGSAALGMLSPTLDLTPRNWARMIEMLSFFNMLPPPIWISEGAMMPSLPPRYVRQLGRELDLSPWFTRPCIIIIGLLEEGSASQSTPSPVPMRVDGTIPPSSGVTVLRWICPLPVHSDLIPAEPRPVLPPEGADAQEEEDPSAPRPRR